MPKIRLGKHNVLDIGYNNFTKSITDEGRFQIQFVENTIFKKVNLNTLDIKFDKFDLNWNQNLAENVTIINKKTLQ